MPFWNKAIFLLGQTVLAYFALAYGTFITVWLKLPTIMKLWKYSTLWKYCTRVRTVFLFWPCKTLQTLNAGSPPWAYWLGFLFWCRLDLIFGSTFEFDTYFLGGKECSGGWLSDTVESSEWSCGVRYEFIIPILRRLYQWDCSIVYFCSSLVAPPTSDPNLDFRIILSRRTWYQPSRQSFQLPYLVFP